MKTIKQFIFCAFLFFAATGCIDDFTLHGNGVEATQSRMVSDFNKIISSGDFEIQVIKGDNLEVTVNAEENLLPYIQTTVSEKTLLIDINGLHNVRNRLPMNVYITVPELTSVKQSGSGNILTDFFTSEKTEFFISGSGSVSAGVHADVLNATISGSGWIFIKGDANQSNLSISGSGNIDNSELVVNNCNANISGSGNIQTNAIKTIVANIAGSGNIYYYGNPVIDLHISGSGKVIPAN